MFFNDIFDIIFNFWNQIRTIKQFKLIILCWNSYLRFIVFVMFSYIFPCVFFHIFCKFWRATCLFELLCCKLRTILCGLFTLFFYRFTLYIYLGNICLNLFLLYATLNLVNLITFYGRIDFTFQTNTNIFNWIKM